MIDATTEWHSINSESESDISSIVSSEGRTEHANCHRLVAKFGQDFHYCNDWKKFIIWDGKQLDEVTDNVPLLTAMASFCKASNSARGIDAMITMGQSNPGIPIRHYELDTNPWMLNLQNVTIDLEMKAGKLMKTLREHRREDFITQVSPVTYNDNADCQDGNNFLTRCAREIRTQLNLSSVRLAIHLLG